MTHPRSPRTGSTRGALSIVNVACLAAASSATQIGKSPGVLEGNIDQAGDAVKQFSAKHVKVDATAKQVTYTDGFTKMHTGKNARAARTTDSRTLADADDYAKASVARTLAVGTGAVHKLMAGVASLAAGSGAPLRFAA